MLSEPLSQQLILHTKLKRPRSVGVTVLRPRLAALLDRSSFVPLTLVSAPPGYGKTILVGGWLDSLTVPWAWYSLNSQDNSLGAFVPYLTAALETAYPGAGATIATLLTSLTLPEPRRLADLFVAELEALPGDLVLVLDDYHEIVEPALHEFLSAVIQHAPPSVHFVLLTRSDPPLKLTWLRTRQQIVEIRATQLRFTVDEARQLMQGVMGDLATDDIVALVTDRTEGWGAGLHLAALSLRDSHGDHALTRPITSSNNQYIADYLVSEVLDLLPAPERTMLLATAILPRFCAPLCDALMAAVPVPATGEPLLDGVHFIERLRAADLFLVALDDEGYWFRFHHLFSDILSNRLRVVVAPTTLAHMHIAAGHWFATQGLIEEAITHYLAAGDAVGAAQLVEAHADSLLNSENRRTLERWLALLPAPVQQRPGVLVVKAWSEQFRYRPGASLALAQAAEDSLALEPDLYSPLQTQWIRGDIAALRAIGHMFSWQLDAARRSAEAALGLVDVNRVYVRGIAELALIRTTSHLGRPAEAIDLGRHWLRLQPNPPNSRTLRLLLAMCGLYYDLLDLDQLTKTAQVYLDLATQAGQWLSVAWAGYFLGYAHYQRNELDLAHRYFAAIVDRPHEAHTRTLVESTCGLVCCLAAAGQVDAARRPVAALRTFLIHAGSVDHAVAADVLDAHLDLMLAQPAAVAPDWAAGLAAQLGLDLWPLPALVVSLAHLRSGSPERILAAGTILDDLRLLLSDAGIPRRMLQIDLQTVLFLGLTGDPVAAVDLLERCVTRSLTGHALRTFVDTGPQLQPYLQELLRRNVHPTAIAQLLRAYAPGGADIDLRPPQSFPLVQGAGSPVAIPATAPTATPPASGPLPALIPEALTNRELDVLLLLDRRLSNQEIGDLLYISPRTVKRHTATIYRKLQVNSRRAAVARARALNLMPPA